MFVSQIDIREFRGIKECDEPLEFSEFTLLIGRNNSGKSSVLEALSLIPLPMDHILSHYRKDRIALLIDIHGGRSSMVYGYSGSASIEYIVRNKVWRIKLADNGNADLFIEDEHFRTAHDQLQAVAITLETKPNPAYINNMVFFIPNDTSFIDSLFRGLEQESTQNRVTRLGAHVRVARELINECVDDKYTEILFTPTLRARKEFSNGNILYIKMKDLGDGVEKTALVALWLEAFIPALVLWDDFEASAHPTLIKVFLDWLCKKKWQVVLSTHSIDVLNSLLDVKPKNAKVMQLKKTGDDILLHQDLSLDDVESLFGANQDPRILVDRLGL